LTVFEPADLTATINHAPADHSVTRTAERKAEQSALNGDDSAPSAEIVAQLKDEKSSERAAALADLAEYGGDDSFRLITKSFDDPSTEVRNAAARALYHLHPDLVASFTRALREASPERRRKIGTAIAGSGLAANAINSLTGEGRDRTYDAFSMLFLMAKAGEVQPLLQAIAKHPDHEVRLTSVKLLALSNQPQILPAFRSLAARETLTPDVQTAVMEAIYLLSSQAREVA
jgi:HEAT repeat protein